jgi:hypothetical protein
MVLSLEEKLRCMKSLNWDYTTSPEDMLAVLEGRMEKAGPFDKKTLLVRSLERFHWEYVVALWGVEKIKALYTPELSRRGRNGCKTGAGLCVSGRPLYGRQRRHGSSRAGQNTPAAAPVLFHRIRTKTVLIC